MKMSSLPLVRAAIPSFFLASMTPAAIAEPSGRTDDKEVPMPIGKHCVVSVISISGPKPVNAGTSNTTTGFAAPSVAEGTLVRMDAQWVVLREGSADHWIPMNKVIMLSANH